MRLNFLCYVCRTAFMFHQRESNSTYPFSGFSFFLLNILQNTNKTQNKKTTTHFSSSSLLSYCWPFVFGSALICFLLFRLKKKKNTTTMRLKQTTINNKASNYEQIKDICADDYGTLLLLLHCSCLLE